MILNLLQHFTSTCVVKIENKRLGKNEGTALSAISKYDFDLIFYNIETSYFSEMWQLMQCIKSMTVKWNPFHPYLATFTEQKKNSIEAMWQNYLANKKIMLPHR